MFASLLIANRGEIACRIAATARRLGIRVVAVYSDADADAAHVAAADEAHRIGPAPARASYLDQDAILEAAIRAEVAAIHPGYGFLSENADFAAAVERAGLAYVGPAPKTIRQMGDKARAKRLAARAGVPVLPGYQPRGSVAAPRARFAKAAAEIGYPVLVKAAAGGGGRGMRVVAAPEALDEALAGAAREAASAFGDASLLLEKYIERPRHIEVQIFGDGKGGVVHMGTRDCSVQRRHQKLIEEAPAPNFDAKRTARIVRAATDLARAVDYRGAGTVEFVVDRAGRFAFIEMNTRLQVEHGVTEMVTGLDLVEWQLRIAAGEPLPLAQRQIRLAGHAIEARLCAEDPARDFLPSAGKLEYLALPETAMRVDSGVRTGDTVSIHYDSLLAKLIALSNTRHAAVAVLREGLGAVRVIGPATNIEFLGRVVRERSFAAGRADTGLVARRRDQLLGPAAPPPDHVLAAAAVAAAGERMRGSSGATSGAPQWSGWADRRNWRLTGVAPLRTTLSQGGARFTASVRWAGDGVWSVVAAGSANPILVREAGRAIASDSFIAGGRRVTLERVRAGGSLYLFRDGDPRPLVPVDPLAVEAASVEDTGALTAPMPGRIARVAVAVGDTVRAGALMMVLEAMKMEHGVHAPGAGRVAEIFHQLGDQVAGGAELIRLDGPTGDGGP